MNNSMENTVEYFHIGLADKAVEIECLSRQVFYMCKDYLTKFDEPDILIEQCTRAEIEYERKQAAVTSLKEHSMYMKFSDAYLETLAVYRKICDALIDYDTILIHSAAVAVGDKCWLFLAPSGTGKTTHIRNWLSEIEGAFVVNGDKPLVNVAKKVVYGTPWCGKEGMNTNTTVPLAGLVILERGEENTIESIPFSDAVPSLLRQVYRPDDGAAMAKVLEHIDALKDVPTYRLRCNMDKESALVAYNYLSKGQA